MWLSKKEYEKRIKKLELQVSELNGTVFEHKTRVEEQQKAIQKLNNAMFQTNIELCWGNSGLENTIKETDKITKLSERMQELRRENKLLREYLNVELKTTPATPEETKFVKKAK